MAKIQVSTNINNEAVEYLCEPHDTMLSVLRNQLDLTGSKESCGSGDCGSCSVILDGELVCSCLMLAAEAEGSKLETIEGMSVTKLLQERMDELSARFNDDSNAQR